MKFKLKKLLMLLVLTVFVFADGCSSKDNTINPTSTTLNFEFLKVGNKLEYEREICYENGELKYKEEHIYTREITNQDENKFYYAIGNELYQSKGIWIVDSLVWRWNNGDVILYKNSFVGQKWETSGSACEVVSINETVKVPAGTFTNCVKIIETTNLGDGEIYYSPKYGLIMEKGPYDVAETYSIFKLISKNF
jgi:hypothetical protein